MPNRRDFLRQAALAAGAVAVGARYAVADEGLAFTANKRPIGRPLRILMLGATGFIGPHHVTSALARGHHVSAFIWSGQKGPIDLPNSVERLLGDRNGDLESIKNRDWDAVIDLATYGPVWVRSLGEALKDRVRHYTFISTIAVYDAEKLHGQTSEDAPLAAYKGNEDPYTVTKSGPQYGPLKAMCEREAEKNFPGRTLILRPGFIVGPGDSFNFFTYWPVRAAHGGNMLVAGDRSTPVQLIDARDIADWLIRLVEHNVTGIYNTMGPTVPTTLGQFISTVCETAPSSPEPTWVSAAWLAKQPDQDLWRKVLFWSFDSSKTAVRMNNARALAAGLTTRPLSVTLKDTLAWHRQLPADRQAELIGYVKLKQDTSGYDVTPMAWPLYLEREKELIKAWQTRQRS